MCRYKFRSLGAIHHGTNLIQPSQMASERPRATITAQLSSERAGDELIGLVVRFDSADICESPLVRLLINLLAQKQKARSTADGL
jgi:hypothetical protein